LKFIPQTIPDIILFEPSFHKDQRGYFFESFRQDLINKAAGYDVNFIQENESKSSKGVLRGLHYQLPPYAQSKLIRVVHGDVLDIVLDIRKSSKTFGQHFSIILKSENNQQLFIPHGFAHGFVVLSDSAIFTYKVDNYYAPNYDRGIAYDDKDLAIDWHLPLDSLQLSEKDKSNPILQDARDLFL
jgi:dTDP-4-dehydrorhamnose 3,5-epimerase